ncbi:helix-turn-helix domain-containing protein [Flavobacterium sp.]
MKIYIRNMACESCKVVVKDALDDLDINFVKVELGEVETKEEISDAKFKKFEKVINKVGLEIVENKGGILIEQIKNCCIEYVNSEKDIKVNASEYLSKKINKDYNYISTLFSEIELQTINNFITSYKMERAKEMIIFDDLSFSEVAHKLNYNNLSAFSAAFKKVTGFNPTHFKNLKVKRRLAIQELSNKQD